MIFLKKFSLIRHFRIFEFYLERLEEAFNVKHCALSLVGEPIMYPEINKVLFI